MKLFTLELVELSKQKLINFLLRLNYTSWRGTQLHGKANKCVWQNLPTFFSLAVFPRNTKFVSHEKLFNLTQNIFCFVPFSGVLLDMMFPSLKWYNFETKKRFSQSGVVSLAMKDGIDTKSCLAGEFSGVFHLMFVIKCQLILFYMLRW